MDVQAPYTSYLKRVIFYTQSSRQSYSPWCVSSIKRVSWIAGASLTCRSTYHVNTSSDCNILTSSGMFLQIASSNFQLSKTQETRARFVVSVYRPQCDTCNRQIYRKSSILLYRWHHTIAGKVSNFLPEPGVTGTQCNDVMSLTLYHRPIATLENTHSRENRWRVLGGWSTARRDCHMCWSESSSPDARK